MIKRKKPILRKTPIKRSTQPIKRTAIKKKPNSSKIKSKSSNPIPKLLDKLETVFHAYIRKRDGPFCISCGEEVPESFIQAGHYMPSTYSTLKFSELNVNSECYVCNCMDQNHLVGYRQNLIKKIGLEMVLYLESHSLSNTVKWDRDELEKLINYYTDKL